MSWGRPHPDLTRQYGEQKPVRDDSYAVIIEDDELPTNDILMIEI